MSRKGSPDRRSGGATTVVVDVPRAGPVASATGRRLAMGLTFITLACSGDTGSQEGGSASVPPPPAGLAHAASHSKGVHQERSRVTLLLANPGGWDLSQVEVEEKTGDPIKIVDAEHALALVDGVRQQVAAVTLKLPRGVAQSVDITLPPENRQYQVVLTPERPAATFGPILPTIQHILRDHGEPTPQLRLGDRTSVSLNSRQWIEGQERMAGLCEYRHEGTSQHVRFRVSSETCAVHGMLVIDGQLFPLDEVEDLEVQEESCIGVLVCREEGEPKEGDTAEVLIESAE